MFIVQVETNEAYSGLFVSSPFREVYAIVDFF